MQGIFLNKKLSLAPSSLAPVKTLTCSIVISFLLFSFTASFAIATPGQAEKPVNRILSLDLCTDWMLARYASRPQILALSPLIHQYPVKWVGKDWPTHDGSIEQILELKPDLVITGEYNAMLLRQRLKELGLRVEILTLPKNLSQVIQYEKHFLKLIGISPDKATKPVSSSVSHTLKNSKSRLLLLGANGIGTGLNTFEDGILQRAGWDNYLQGEGYISLDLEQVIGNPPDAVLWSAPASRALSNLFAEHPALKQAIPAERWLSTEYWNWQCPGPWTWELIDQLQAWIPE